MLYISRRLDAQINCITEDTPDPDILRVKITIRGFTFSLWNVYNERDLQGSNKLTIERALFNLRARGPRMVLGDFNLHHHWWDPLCERESTLAAPFLDWIQDQRLHLLNEPGLGTYFRSDMDRDSTLDLTFASPDLLPLIQRWEVLSNVGSDHHPILFTMDLPRPSIPDCPIEKQRYNTSKADWDAFTESFTEAPSMQSLFHDLQHFPQPTPALSKSLLTGQELELEQMLDDLGSKLTEAITEAAAKSIPRIKPGLRSKPWWNDDLKQLRQDMNRKQRQFAKESKRCSPEDCLPWKTEYLNARNTYFTEIKSAKRDHWNTFLEKEDPRSIFKAMAYTQSTTSQRMPSIQSAHSLEDTFDGKCSALRSALFPKPPETSLPDWDTYSPREHAWEWPPLSKIELREACSSKVKSKTPGPDNITQDIIIAAYRANDELFFRIFSLFFNYGYHPRCWKQATGVIIKKKGKPDYSAPKAYRVIFLLNCLGKVLERILAKRLGALAEVTHLLHPTQIGGRSRKSAIDAGLLLLDNVQEQRRLGRQTSTVFLDIKGAFDHVAQNQLLSVMRKLNLPLSLISWTRSFLTERLLRLTFDGQAQDFNPIQSGIPQGSPISPILFLIYIRDLFQISQNSRFPTWTTSPSRLPAPA